MATVEKLTGEVQREFRADLSRFYMVCVPAAVMIGYFIWFGIKQYRLQTELLANATRLGGHIESGFPPWWMFTYLPWIFSATILIVLVAIWLSHHNRKLVITARTVEMHRGIDRRRTQWQNVSFTAPPPGKKRFRSALLSDGTYYERIDEFFYHDFDEIVELIQKHKMQARASFST